jgi:Fe-S-cluster formation regulator IscX/YfhJ
MSFAELKRKRSSSINKLVAAASDLDGPKTTKSYVDERQWKPVVDKAGNGYAVIRFLPAPEGNELPWVRFWDHGFKGPTGQWYIEKSLTSIGQQDPVSEANTKLWNSGDDRDKEIARERKRRLHYVANILVEQDAANPDNEGKVFLYTFGKKIHDKIMDVMQPQFADEDPINPFCFWEGASFKLKIRNVEGYRNYDKSEFAKPSALSESDEDLEKLYEKLYDLNEFTDPANYKSYTDLHNRLMLVLGQDEPKRFDLETESAPKLRSVPEPEFSSASAEPEDDAMSYFAKLAQED